MRRAKPHPTRRLAVRNECIVAADTDHHQRNFITNQPLDEADEEENDDDDDKDVIDSLEDEQNEDPLDMPTHMSRANQYLDPSVIVTNKYATDEFRPTQEVEQIYCYDNQTQQKKPSESSSAVAHPIFISLTSSRLGRRLLRSFPLVLSKRQSSPVPAAIAANQNDVLVATAMSEQEQQNEESFYINTIISDHHYTIESPTTIPTSNRSSGSGTYKSVTTFVDRYRSSRSRDDNTELDSQETKTNNYCAGFGDECWSQSLFGWLALACFVLVLLFVYISVTLSRRSLNSNYASAGLLKDGQESFTLGDIILELRPTFNINISSVPAIERANKTSPLQILESELKDMLNNSQLRPWLRHVEVKRQWFDPTSQHFFVNFSITLQPQPLSSFPFDIRQKLRAIFYHNNQSSSGLFYSLYPSDLIESKSDDKLSRRINSLNASDPAVVRLQLVQLEFDQEPPVAITNAADDENASRLHRKSDFDTSENIAPVVSSAEVGEYWKNLQPDTQPVFSATANNEQSSSPGDEKDSFAIEHSSGLTSATNRSTLPPSLPTYLLMPSAITPSVSTAAPSKLEQVISTITTNPVACPNGSVCRSNYCNMRCDASYSNNLTNHVQTPLYPKPLPPQTRWTMCVFLLPDICRVKVIFLNFIGSKSVNDGDASADTLQINGKVFTGKSWNGTTLWLDLSTSASTSNFSSLHSADSARQLISIVFTTDSDERGNMLSLLVEQEPCNMDNANLFPSPTSTGTSAAFHDCRHQLLLNENQQTLTSAVAPYYYTVPYADNLNCQTTFTSVPAHACGLNIHINQMSIEGDPEADCKRSDYLQIADKLFCGQKKQDETVLIQLPSKHRRELPFKLLVLWHTDASFSSTGFNISYGWIYSCQHNIRF